MKRSTLYIILIAIGYLLFSATKVEAQVVGCTSVDFDDSTGVIYAQAWIESEYGTIYDYQ